MILYIISYLPLSARKTLVQFPFQKPIDSELEKKRQTKKRVPVIIEFAKNKKEELSNDRHG